MNFVAYKNRRKKVESILLDRIIPQALLSGYTVLVHKSDAYINSATLYNNEKTEGVRVQFNEVPYRWTLEYCIKPSIEQGSGFSTKERYDIEQAFTLDELVSNFKPMYFDERFSHHYTHFKTLGELDAYKKLKYDKAGTE